MGDLARRVTALEAAAPSCRACRERGSRIAMADAADETPAPSACPECGRRVEPFVFTLRIDRRDDAGEGERVMTSRARRVDALEASAAEAQLRGMAAEAGCSFEEFRRKVRELAPKVTAWRAAGMTERQVMEQIVRDAAEGCAFTEDEFREAVDEAERFLRDEVRPRWAR